MNKFIILDRDGVLNKDTGYVHEWALSLHSIYITRQMIKWRNNGFKFVVITNQSGIARGYYSEKQ